MRVLVVGVVGVSGWRAHGVRVALLRDRPRDFSRFVAARVVVNPVTSFTSTNASGGRRVAGRGGDFREPRRAHGFLERVPRIRERTHGRGKSALEGAARREWQSVRPIVAHKNVFEAIYIVDVRADAHRSRVLRRALVRQCCPAGWRAQNSSRREPDAPNASAPSTLRERNLGEGMVDTP